MLHYASENACVSFPDVETDAPAISDLSNAHWTHLRKQLCQGFSPIQVHECGHGEQDHNLQDHCCIDNVVVQGIAHNTQSK